MIINIKKPGKNDGIGKNWRQIRLLRTAVKTLEKRLLPKIQTHIPTYQAQHGARSDSCIRQCGSSTTARLCLQHQHTSNNLIAGSTATMNNNNIVLKELAATTWECDKEALLTTYQAIDRSILS